MASFMTDEQRQLAAEIASRLVARSETVAVAETTTGGLVSAALLAVPGASRYYVGGGVLYTRDSRIALAGVPEDEYDGYRGRKSALVARLAEGMQLRLEATWCIAETGLAGPTGGRSGGTVGQTIISVAGPVARTETIETGLEGREANMVEFTTRTLRFLLDAIREADKQG